MISNVRRQSKRRTPVVLPLGHGRDDRGAGLLFGDFVAALGHHVDVEMPDTSTTSELYDTARGIVKQLRPKVLDTLGLQGALAEMIREYDQLHTTCRFKLQSTADFPALRGDVASACYRIIQEALSNVVKHSGATQARVKLSWIPESASIAVRIADNGAGFNVSAAPPGRLGLAGMKERATTLSGSMTILSRPSRGTLISIVLPTRSRTVLA